LKKTPDHLPDFFTECVDRAFLNKTPGKNLLNMKPSIIRRECSLNTDAHRITEILTIVAKAFAELILGEPTGLTTLV
jgi:hypothetical protein